MRGTESGGKGVDIYNPIRTRLGSSEGLDSVLLKSNKKVDGENRVHLQTED